MHNIIIELFFQIFLIIIYFPIFLVKTIIKFIKWLLKIFTSPNERNL